MGLEPSRTDGSHGTRRAARVRSQIHRGEKFLSAERNLRVCHGLAREACRTGRARAGVGLRIEMQSDNKNARPRVVVTTSWDDDAVSGLDIAQLLGERRLPGTFYVPTGQLGEASR